MLKLTSCQEQQKGILNNATYCPIHMRYRVGCHVSASQRRLAQYMYIVAQRVVSRVVSFAVVGLMSLGSGCG